MNQTFSKQKIVQGQGSILFTVAKVSLGGMLILMLASCDVLRESDTDSGIGGKGIAAKGIQPDIGRGSPSDWKSTTCAVVEGRTQWKWIPAPKDGTGESENADPHIFQIDKPGEWKSKGKLGDVLITLLPLSSCKIDDESTIAYSTKDWLCIDDYVRVNDTDCLIKSIETL